MSVNASDIQTLAEETELVIYGDEFNVLEVNYKLAEKSFLGSHGRRFNEEEQEELKAALATRAQKDKALTETTALESCETHKDLVMSGTTLESGVETFTEAVTAEVKEALVKKGISYTFTVAGHPESAAKLNQYIDAAREL